MHNHPDEEALMRAEENRRFRTGNPWTPGRSGTTDLPDASIFEWNATCNQLPRNSDPVLGSWIGADGTPIYVVTRFVMMFGSEPEWFVRGSDNMDLFSVRRSAPLHWAYIQRPSGGRYR